MIIQVPTVIDAVRNSINEQAKKGGGKGIIQKRVAFKFHDWMEALRWELESLDRSGMEPTK